MFIRKDYETWREKIIVEDEHVKIHRLLPKTEFVKILKNYFIFKSVLIFPTFKIEAGRNASNQIDKYKSLLKDRPKKKGLVTKSINS